jgi:predicted methyltransferase
LFGATGARNFIRNQEDKPMKMLALTALSLIATTPAIAHEGMDHSAHAKMASPITAALADPARPAKQREADTRRSPEKLIAFANIKPGQTVVDYVMGGGYWSHIIAGVVGPKGKVYGFQPTEFVAYRAAYGTEQDDVVKARKNVTPIRSGFAAPAIPGKVDAIITVQNYHDLYLKPFPADTGPKARAALFAMLKPGGTLVIVDHSAKAGSDIGVADSLHRIDPAIVRKELEAAGFVFDGELDTWRNPADPMTANVFDPAIRGKTDQFAYRFKKPK